ncbi:hypothetical protein KAR04_08000 [Candidatus Calescamantes bacterium]|nr:hypothetical protein [Candidatus Calescamantes bacterium]
MAESLITKTKRDGTITIRDGTTPTANEYTVAFEAGDLSVTIAGRTVNLFLDRGVLTDPPQIRYGDDQPMSGSFTAQLRDVSDATDETLAAILLDTGVINTGWVGRGGSTREVKTFQLEWTIEGTDHGDAADHTITLDYCYITGSLADGDPAVVTINFTSFQLYPAVT